MATKFSLLEMKKYERAERKEYGTVRQVMKQLSKDNPVLKPSGQRNLLSNLNVYLIIEDSKGLSTGLSCSKEVSRLIRSKEITLTQVLDFPIIEHTIGADFKNAGAIIPLITMPVSDSTTIEGVSVDAVADKAFAPATVDINSLIAL